MNSGEKQNKRSEVGEHIHKGHQAEHVRDIEHVGSSGAHGIRFKMPTETCDHSVVTPEK